MAINGLASPKDVSWSEAIGMTPCVDENGGTVNAPR
jgi:hypothetical protein